MPSRMRFNGRAAMNVIEFTQDLRSRLQGGHRDNQMALPRTIHSPFPQPFGG
jgi:hypothetical protein